MPSRVNGTTTNIRIITLASAFLLLCGCGGRDESFSRDLREANERVNQGDFAGAIEILVPLNEERPSQIPVVEALAFAYAGNGDHTLAAWHMIQLADLDPAQPDLRLLAAKSLETAGDPESAIEQYRLYLKSETQDARAWQHLADLCRMTNNPRGAIEALLARQTLDPSPETAFALGQLFRSLNNSPQAQVWFATAARADGSNADAARLNLLELSLAEDDFRTAADLAASLQDRLGDPEDRRRLENSREQIKAWQASESTLEAARRERERLASEVGRLRREQEAMAAENARRAEADARASRLAQEEAQRERPVQSALPQSGTAGAAGRTDVATGEAAEALAAAGDPQGAVAAYWKAINADDTRPGLWLGLSRAYIALQQWTEAESCVLEARRRDRKNPRIEETYLQIVRRTRPFDVFLAEVTAARNRFPQSPDLALQLAEALSAAGTDTLQAIRAYEDFLLLAPPDDPRIPQTQNTLDRLRGW